MKRERWDAPAPDGESPEAEWGFEETLRADVEQLAAARGHRVVRIVFDEPEDPSPLVAELYRWWYRARGIPANRLLVDSFILLDPWWTLRLGAVPFWMVQHGGLGRSRGAPSRRGRPVRRDPPDAVRPRRGQHRARRSSAGAACWCGQGSAAAPSAWTRRPSRRISPCSPATTPRCARFLAAIRCQRR